MPARPRSLTEPSAISANAMELTNWTVRLSLLCYAAVLCGNAAADGCRHWPDIARWLWTAGCLLLLAHIGCAFQFVHHWQHNLAVAETARRTAAVVGWEFGGGVYFNYAFALIWLGDVVWWWAAKASYRQRPRLVNAIVHSYLFFIAFNGAIVFVAGPTRWIGIAFVLLWSGLAFRAMRNRDNCSPQHQEKT